MICANQRCRRVSLLPKAADGVLDLSVSFQLIRAELCEGCLVALVEVLRREPLICFRAASAVLGLFERQTRLEPWFPKPTPPPERGS